MSAFVPCNHITVTQYYTLTDTDPDAQLDIWPGHSEGGLENPIPGDTLARLGLAAPARRQTGRKRQMFAREESQSFIHPSIHLCSSASFPTNTESPQFVHEGHKRPRLSAVDGGSLSANKYLCIMAKRALYKPSPCCDCCNTSDLQ